MPPIRQMLATTGAALLLVALVSATQAQGPGGPPGGGGPGGGGPGGRGGFGGRRGGGILGLLDYPAVQEEIKLTDDQKQKIADVKAAVAKKRQALMPRRNNNTANGGAANGAVAGGANGGANPAAGGGQDGATKGNRGNRRGNNTTNTPAVDADGNPIPGGVANGGQGGPGGGRGQGGPGGFGGFGGPGGGMFQFTPEQQAAFQELQAYSTSANANITNKILDKKQVARLTEIDLQRQGPMAVLNDDIALKLNISEDVLAEMKGIQDQGRQSRMEMFQAARQNGPSFQTADGQFDRAAMRAYRDSAEGKAAMQKMQQSTESMQKQTIAQIGKLLSKKQKAKFKAMQGKDFDLAKLTNNPNTPATATPATGTTKAAAAANTTSKAQPKATAKKKATGKRTTTTSNP